MHGWLIKKSYIVYACFNTVGWVQVRSDIGDKKAMSYYLISWKCTCTVYSPTQQSNVPGGQAGRILQQTGWTSNKKKLDSVFLYWIFSQSTQVWLHCGSAGAPTLQARVLSFKPGASRPTDAQRHGPQQRGLEQPCRQQSVTVDSSGQRGRYY